MRETVRELGERKARSFLKKFYGWYLGRGRFPRPLKPELTQLDDARGGRAPPARRRARRTLRARAARVRAAERGRGHCSTCRSRSTAAVSDRPFGNPPREGDQGGFDEQLRNARAPTSRHRRRPPTVKRPRHEHVEARERPVVHPIAAAKDRFGGIDFPASLVGMLTALATVVLLGGLVGAAVGAIGVPDGPQRRRRRGHLDREPDRRPRRPLRLVPRRRLGGRSRSRATTARGTA